MIASPIEPNKFLQVVEAFNTKCTSGKQLAAHDVSEFYEVISKGLPSNSKEHVPTTASNTSDPTLNKKIADALQKLKMNIGQNKSVIESAAQGLPIHTIVKAVDSHLELYAKQQSEDALKISRKNKNQLDRGA